MNHMNDLIAASRQALSCVEAWDRGCDRDAYWRDIDECVTALRTAIEAAEKQEPVAVVSGYYGGQCVIQPLNPARVFNSGTAFYAAPIAAPVQGLDVYLDPADMKPKRYTPAAPVQWVGLTDEEYAEAEKAVWAVVSLDDTEKEANLEFYRAIEAMLREKNGGAA